MTTRADELIAAARALAEAVGGASDGELLQALAEAAGWGARAVGAMRLPSGVSHGVPWGVSMAVGTREVRVFLEAQCDPPSAAGYREAAGRVTAVMERWGADATRWRRWAAIVEESAAAGSEGRATRLWHALVLVPGMEPRWHAYVCVPPSDQPRLAARLLVDAGIEPSVVAAWLRPVDRISIVSLDLDASATARVKVYVHLPDADAADVAALHDRARGAVAGDAQRFVRAMLGDEVRRIWWLVTLGFVVGSTSPETVTLHFGVPRHLDEATATTRVRALLEHLELPTASWERARRDHHFVTFQRAAGQPRITTYFLPPGGAV